jgi:hypothetical protein
VVQIAFADANIQHTGRRYNFRRSYTFYIVYTYWAVRTYLCCPTCEEKRAFIDRHHLSPHITISLLRGVIQKNMKGDIIGGGHRYKHDYVPGYQDYLSQSTLQSDTPKQCSVLSSRRRINKNLCGRGGHVRQEANAEGQVSFRLRYSKGRTSRQI